jgi:hypothetical protein
MEKWSYIMRGVTLTLMASLEEDNLVVIDYLNGQYNNKHSFKTGKYIVAMETILKQRHR